MGRFKWRRSNYPSGFYYGCILFLALESCFLDWWRIIRFK
nr:MAG TPA: hypothetical protein [Caudoviricetes sp.]